MQPVNLSVPREQLASKDDVHVDRLNALWKLSVQRGLSDAERIRTMLAMAARVLDMDLAVRLVRLAGSLLEGGNRNVITDVGAAAEAARAAAVTSRLNIEVNLRGIT